MPSIHVEGIFFTHYLAGINKTVQMFSFAGHQISDQVYPQNQLAHYSGTTGHGSHRFF